MEGKYSLMIMSDSGKTTRWRVSPTVLHALIVVVVLLPLLMAGSLWLNWKLFMDRRAVLTENATLRHDVEANAQTVARLSGLERFLIQTAPDSLGDLVAVTPDPAPAAGNLTPDLTRKTADSADSAPSMPSSTGEGIASGVTSGGTQGDTTGGTSASGSPLTTSTLTSSASTGTPSEGNPSSSLVLPPVADSAPVDTSAQNQEAASSNDAVQGKAEETAPSSPASAANPPVTTSETVADDAVVDKGFARVENLTARRAGSRALRVSFDLFNTEQVQQLSGKTTFELITKEGKSYPLDAHGDTTFRINRLKKIVGNPTLPADVTNLTGASVQVSIFADDDLIYRVTTPIR